MALEFFKIDANYVKELNKIDSRVQYHHGNNSKPYIGVVLKIDDMNYFIPLSSKKPKYDRMKERLTLVKIEDGKRLLSVLSVNNMIPVPSACVSPLDISKVPDQKYKDLLQREYIGCMAKERTIKKNAKLLYRFMTVEPEKHNNIARYCVDFKKLESYAKQYASIKKPQNKFEERLEKIKKVERNTTYQERTKSR